MASFHRAVLVAASALLAGCGGGGGETTGTGGGGSSPSDDMCKKGSPTPEVIVGHGFGDYYNAPEMDVAEVEAGPQGGYHIWIGARVRGLLQSGSLTEVDGVVDDLGLEFDGGRYVFTLEQDEGGYCKIYGLRLIIANSMSEIEPLLGHPIDVTVEIVDSEDDVGRGERTLLLSEDIIGL